MRLRIGLRACGMTAALLGTALGVVAPSQASNTSPQAEAYVVSAQALGGLVAVPPTPDSTFPPGGTQSLPTLNLGPIAVDALLTATTAGDAKAGTASASAAAAHLLLTIPLVGALDVTGIKATCDAPASPGAATGTGTVATAVFTPVPPPAPLPPATPVTITVPTGVNQTVTVPQLGTIVVNKQVTDKDGNLTVEAADITLVGGQEVVLGSAMCGGAMPASNSATHPTH
ncbi:choice-of-anchor P family protein [Catenulispora acidiphila]|nr:choice-of-anchor P family protein [Catenulispora acidiphila]